MLGNDFYFFLLGRLRSNHRGGANLLKNFLNSFIHLGLLIFCHGRNLAQKRAAVDALDMLFKSFPACFLLEKDFFFANVNRVAKTNMALWIVLKEAPLLHARISIYKLLTSGFLSCLGLLFLFHSSLAKAQDCQTLVNTAAQLQAPQSDAIEKQYIPKALRLDITARGRQYLQGRFQQILENQGISFSEGYFQQSDPLIADKNIDFDNLDMDDETKQLVLSTREFLTTWFMGFPLRDIRPALLIGDSGYEAVFTKFNIDADETLLKKIGKTEGAVLVLDAEAKKVDIVAKFFRLWDENTKGKENFLGEVGLDGIRMQVGGGKNTLKLKIPMYVNIDSNGQLVFEALNAEENFKEVDLNLTFGKLILPAVTVVVNGKSFPMDQTKANKEFNNMMPTILQKIRTQLSDFVRTQLPTTLNEKVKEYMKGSLEEVSLMDPPGVTEQEKKSAGCSPNFHFRRGQKLTRIQHLDNLSFQLDAFIEDPQRPKTPLKPELASRGEPHLNYLASTEYDTAFTIDRGFFNRGIQLSFNRGYFKEVGTGDSKLKLIKAPLIDALNKNMGKTAEWGVAYARLTLNIRTNTGPIEGFWDNIALDQGDFDLSFDALTKIEKAVDKNGKPTQQVSLSIVDIIMDSIKIDRPSVKKLMTGVGKFFAEEKIYSSVAEKVRENFAKESASLKKTPSELDKILLPDLWGLNFTVKHMVMDPNGHLIIYLNFVKPAVKP